VNSGLRSPRQLEHGRGWLVITRRDDPVSMPSAVDAEQKHLGVWEFISREVPILRAKLPTATLLPSNCHGSRPYSNCHYCHHPLGVAGWQ
jgi:hypothetical protein